MNSPKVSVLIPLYNCELYIEEAIESVLNQTFQNFELIIVDNCSTDKSYEIIQKYKSDCRIKIHRNERNVGMTRNWNRCLLIATGEYVKFLCADDYFEPNLLEKYVSVFDNLYNVSLVISPRKILHYNGNFECQAPFFVGLKRGEDVYINSVMWHSNPLGMPTSIMFRRRDLEIGFFNIDLEWVVDVDYWYRLCLIGDVFGLDQHLAVYRLHKGQETIALRTSNKFIIEEREFLQYNFFSRNSKLLGNTTMYNTAVQNHVKRNYKNGHFKLNHISMFVQNISLTNKLKIFLWVLRISTILYVRQILNRIKK